MTRSMSQFLKRLTVGCGLLPLLAWPSSAWPQPDPAAVAAFDAYVHRLELRLDAQHRSRERFLALDGFPGTEQRLRTGEPIIERRTPEGGLDVPDGLLHDWRGTAFVPGGTAEEFEELLRDFSTYPRIFAPDVVRASASPARGDHLQANLRVVQHHILTVVLDTTYDVAFGELDAKDRFSISRSAHIAEIADAGTAQEHALSPSQEHGYLWRLNTYWSCAQRDGGLYIQIESVSLTRGIPTGLGWAVRPLIASVPRASLELTLRAASKAIADRTRSTR